MDQSRRMKHLMRRCLRDQSAGVALVFAISVLPVIGVIGIAVDFGLATQAKTQLNLAADAAALAAAKGAADAFTAGKSVAEAQTAGRTAGLEWFNSQAGTVLGTTLQPPVVTWLPTPDPVFSPQVTFQGTVKPYFASLFGINTIALGGSSTAIITTNAYVSVTFLLDNSSSMLIAATQGGVNTMVAATPYPDKKSRDAVPRGLGQVQCAYACHWDKDNNDYYGLALDAQNGGKNRITLRLDVLTQAAENAIQKMRDQRKIDNQFSVAVYTFRRHLNLVYPDNTDLVSGKAAAGGVQVPLVSDNGDTDFPTVMTELVTASAKTSPAGDGSSTTKRRKALIIVTDGMADYYKDGKNDGRVIPDSEGPIKAADCAGMKSLKYSIYVLYTTYIATPTDLMLHFDPNLAPYVPSIVPALKSCASAPTNYAEASDPTAINTAMTQLLQSALSNSGRYTQ